MVGLYPLLPFGAVPSKRCYDEPIILHPKGVNVPSIHYSLLCVHNVDGRGRGARLSFPTTNTVNTSKLLEKAKHVHHRLLKLWYRCVYKCAFHCWPSGFDPWRQFLRGNEVHWGAIHNIFRSVHVQFELGLACEVDETHRPMTKSFLPGCLDAAPLMVGPTSRFAQYSDTWVDASIPCPFLDVAKSSQCGTLLSRARRSFSYQLLVFISGL